MNVLYKITRDEKFDCKIEHLLELSEDLKTVEWIILPHPPKDMHFKAADQYGLGGKYHNGKQSIADFHKEPTYEINPIAKDIIFQIINTSIGLIQKVNEIKSITQSKRMDFSIDADYYFPTYTFKLEGKILFSIKDVKDRKKEEAIESLILLLKRPNSLN